MNIKTRIMNVFICGSPKQKVWTKEEKELQLRIWKKQLNRIQKKKEKRRLAILEKRRLAILDAKLNSMPTHKMK